jgi:hypothetical protein
MTKGPITYQQWRREAPAQRAKSASLIAAFGEIRRDKPRDAAEADFLRRIGTPERLVGPSRAA